MRKPKIYIETSVWSHLFAEDAPEQRASAEKLFAEIEDYEIYVSNVVAAEIGRTKDAAQRGRLVETIQTYQPIELEITQEVLDLAQRYLDEEIIPAKKRNDALHVAVASVEELNIVVSLNMGHIVRVKTRSGVNAINRLAGYKEIEIATPEEVLGYGKN